MKEPRKPRSPRAASDFSHIRARQEPSESANSPRFSREGSKRKELHSSRRSHKKKTTSRMRGREMEESSSRRQRFKDAGEERRGKKSSVSPSSRDRRDGEREPIDLSLSHVYDSLLARRQGGARLQFSQELNPDETMTAALSPDEAHFYAMEEFHGQEYTPENREKFRELIQENAEEEKSLEKRGSLRKRSRSFFSSFSLSALVPSFAQSKKKNESLHGAVADIGERQKEKRRDKRRRYFRQFLMLLATLAVVASVGWMVKFSPLFALRVEDIRVEKFDSHFGLTVQNIKDSLAPYAGESTVVMNTRKMEKEILSSNPLIGSIDITAQPMHGVEVKVSEKELVACVEEGEECRAVDRMGQYVPLAADIASTLPHVVVNGEEKITSEKIDMMLKVLALMDDQTRAQISHVHVDEKGFLTLTLQGGASVLWGDSSQSDLKSRVLASLLSQGAQFYDISVPEAPLTRAQQ